MIRGKLVFDLPTRTKRSSREKVRRCFVLAVDELRGKKMEEKKMFRSRPEHFLSSIFLSYPMRVG